MTRYAIWEHKAGFSRQIGETEDPFIAFQACRQNAADQDIETYVLPDDGRTGYSFMPGGREMLPMLTNAEAVKDDYLAHLAKEG